MVLQEQLENGELSDGMESQQKKKMNFNLDLLRLVIYKQR